MKYGFVKVASAIPAVKVTDTKYNLDAITKLLVLADGQGVEIINFPELSITGYTCQDLFNHDVLLDHAEHSVLMLKDITRQIDIITIVGVPISIDSLLLNCAVVIQHGKILGIVPKTYIPNYHEFYEKRWFASASDLKPTEVYYAGQQIIITPEPQLFKTYDGVKFGIEICEDLWAPTPVSNKLTMAGAEIIFNLSATNELIGKYKYLKQLILQQSARTISAYVYSSAGYGESTQDVVYGGNAIIAENGSILSQSKRFCMEDQMVTTEIDIERLRTERRANTTFTLAQKEVSSNVNIINCLELNNPEVDFKLTRKIAPHPFYPDDDRSRAERCEEIFNIQSLGLAKRLQHIKTKTVVIGISGGLDSTLALLVAVKTFDRLNINRKGILGVTMPGFGTTDRTLLNARKLMQLLGVSIIEINIAEAVTQHLKDISHDISIHDTTYENAQARERTQILMDLSNKYHAIVVGTGDLSELALGWCTYNGDHMSMYGVNVGVPKTLVKHLVKFVADSTDKEEERKCLLDIIATPISPELTPADEHGNIVQQTEDLVGPYQLHDFFLYYFLRHGFSPSKILFLAKNAFQSEYTTETIKKWLNVFIHRFFTQQFKRSCLPDGPKVGSVSLSPRGDWRMPSDASESDWKLD